MLNALIRWSLRRRGLVLGLALSLVAVSAWRVPQMPVEVFPELNAPTVVVMTEAPGLAADAKDQVMVGFCDGSVQFLAATLDPKTWLAYFTKNGGEVIQQ